MKCLVNIKFKDICPAGNSKHMNNAYLLTGGNLGDRLRNLDQAMDQIRLAGCSIVAASALYETAAWGLEQQPKFLNQALEISTSLHPEELLVQLLAIEERIGRVRKEKFGPRLIDIDILLYGSLVINTPTLKLPHPELVNRRFALTPLAEIAGALLHPVFNKTINQLLEECTDTLTVTKR